jgi:hypothetical protein
MVDFSLTASKQRAKTRLDVELEVHRPSLTQAASFKVSNLSLSAFPRTTRGTHGIQNGGYRGGPCAVYPGNP